MVAVALVLLFALIGDLKVSAIPTMLVLGFLVSLPLIMLNVHGRVLKFMGLAALLLYLCHCCTHFRVLPSNQIPAGSPPQLA